ncbi:MAG: DUF2971 domain-containing protein [Pirellulales bacterium]
MMPFRKLYKYRSLSGDARAFTRRILEHQQLYYAAPGQFNDPFDCRFQISLEGAPLTKAGLAKRDEIQAFCEAWFRDEKNNAAAVLALSEANDDILMWSHYADCHCGVCLGFRVPLDNELHAVSYDEPPATLYFADFFPEYRNQERFASSIIGTLTRKAPAWSYEREWRCIELSGRGEQPIPDGMLCEVIFGCRTSKEDRSDVRKWLGSRVGAVQFFEACARDRAFGMDVRPLN